MNQIVKDFKAMMEKPENIRNSGYWFVTTPEYQALVEDSNDDGWIKWEGGSCPVDGKTTVTVKFRNGEQNYGVAMHFTCWYHDNDYESGAWDILAYKIVKDKPTGHNLSPVPDHIDRAYCLEVELDEVVGQIRDAKSLEWLKETTRRNFPKSWDVEDKMTDTRAIDPTNGSPVEQSANNAQCSKYTTVEGHAVVRDGEYETRKGEKAIVLGFREGSAFPVSGESLVHFLCPQFAIHS